jgi:homopolymeric O-antigen transport system ATP-binding protein
MAQIAVSANGLGKRYKISHGRASYDRVTDAISNLVRKPIDRVRGRKPADEWIWALRDATFEVPAGQIIGVIGRNGAGKSTLLKILARITAPTVGTAIMRGRVSSLLEVGTGFHQELTGRENVYLSGSILGMKRSEIDRCFDEIVAFSEIEAFIDTPVKRYSSGMLVRLGFAVAAHLQNDILIVDEVLAVGDAAFQRKSTARMEGASRDGRTILFVSHNMPAVEALCSEAILLEAGRITERGTSSAVVQAYLQRALAQGTTPIEEREDRRGNGRLRFVSIDSAIRTGSTSQLRLGYDAKEDLRNVIVNVGLYTSRGEGALHLSSQTAGQDLTVQAGRGTIVVELPKTGLLPGRYRVNLYCTAGGAVVDWLGDAATIEVAEGDYYGTGRLPPPGYGSIAVDQAWSVEVGAR